jgi:hypothetical protein
MLLRRVPPELAASLCVVFALFGAMLLGTSELTDRFESVFGLSSVSLFFALPIATVVVCVAAISGDSILVVVERRVGRRMGRRLRLMSLAVPGLAATVVIGVHHVRHLPALDASLGLAGGLLLLLAAGFYRHATTGERSFLAHDDEEVEPVRRKSV